MTLMECSNLVRPARREWADGELRPLEELGLECRRRAEDGLYGVRFRTPGGELAGEQVREVAAIARTVPATIEVTRRGLLGLDGIPRAGLGGIASRLAAVGLIAPGGASVQVTTHPWAGFDPGERIDTRALAWRLAASLPEERSGVEILIDGRADPAPACWTYALAFVAAGRPDGTTAFRCLVGGARGPDRRPARALPVWVREGQVPGVARQILALAPPGDGPSRLARLVGRLGVAALVEQLRAGLDEPLEPADEPVTTPGRDDDEPGWFAQKQPGLWAAALAILPAQLVPERLEALARIAEARGDGTLRTAPGRRLVLANVAAADRPRVGLQLDELGLGAGLAALPEARGECAAQAG